MLTRIEASWSDAVTVDVQPTTEPDSSLSAAAGAVTVRLAEGAALAVTLPDGTSALAPGDGSPARFDAVIGLTVLEPDVPAQRAGGAPTGHGETGDAADGTILVGELRAALEEFTDDTLVGLDALSAALDRSQDGARTTPLEAPSRVEDEHDAAPVTAGRRRGRRAGPRPQEAPAPPIPRPLSFTRPVVSGSALAVAPPPVADPLAAAAPEGGSHPQATATALAAQAEDADATTVAPRALRVSPPPGAAGATDAPAGPPAPAAGIAPSRATGGEAAAPPAPAGEDPDLTTVRPRAALAAPAHAPGPAAGPRTPGPGAAVPGADEGDDPDLTTLAPRGVRVGPVAAAASAAPVGRAAPDAAPVAPLGREAPEAGPTPSGPAAPPADDPDLTTVGPRPSRPARTAPAHRVPPAPVTPPAGTGTLLLVQDAHGTREVPLAGTVVIGRTPSPAQVRERDARGLVVVPTGTGVSHSHAAIRRQGSVVLVRDLWSTNGTRVRSGGVPPFRLRDGEEVPVSDGTVVELGDGVVITILERGEG